MVTVRRIPDSYPTLVDAAADAQTGDAIVLAPGTHVYSGNSITWPAVHFIGESGNTADTIIRCDTYGRRNYIRDYDFTGTLLVEGITMHMTQAWQGMLNYGLGAGATVHFNKVLRTGTSSSSQWMELIENSTINIKITNCSNNIDQYNDSLSPWHCSTASTVEITQCYWPYPVDRVDSTLFTSLAAYSLDTVTSSTENYGYDSGHLLGLEYVNAPIIRIAGVIEAPDLTGIRIFLHRAHPVYGIDRYIAGETEIAEDGSWEFTRVSAGDSYYVVVLPSEGYKPLLIGPYNPAD